jgi:hypothetical protein
MSFPYTKRSSPDSNLESGEEQGKYKFHFRIRRGALFIADWRQGFQDSGTELFIYIALLAGLHFWKPERSKVLSDENRFYQAKLM